MSDYTTSYLDENGEEYTCMWQVGNPRYADSRGDFGPKEVELLLVHGPDGTLVKKDSELWEEILDSWDDAQKFEMEYDKYGMLL